MNQVEQAAAVLEQVLVSHVETTLQKQWGEGWRLAVSEPQADGAPWDLPALAETIRGNPGLFDKGLQKEVKALLGLWTKRQTLSGRQASEFVERVRTLVAQRSPGMEEQLAAEAPAEEVLAEEQPDRASEELGIEEEEPALDADNQAQPMPQISLVDDDEAWVIGEEAEGAATPPSPPPPPSEPNPTPKPKPEQHTVTPADRRLSPIVRVLAALPLLALVAVLILGAAALWQSKVESQRGTDSRSAGAPKASTPLVPLPPQPEKPQDTTSTQPRRPSPTPPSAGRRVVRGWLGCCGGVHSMGHSREHPPDASGDEITWQCFTLKSDRSVLVQTAARISDCPTRIGSAHYELKTPAPASGTVVTGSTNPQPRPLRPNYPNQAELEELKRVTREILTIDRYPETAPIHVTMAFKTDLDGDGYDEEVWIATSCPDTPHDPRAEWRGAADSKPNNYSVVVARYRDSDAALRWQVLTRWIHEDALYHNNGVVYELLPPIDEDGDGDMHFIIQRHETTGGWHTGFYTDASDIKVTTESPRKTIRQGW